ncbi:MAG: cyclic peptide export ABC transporter, partial [Phormidesmis sp.]
FIYFFAVGLVLFALPRWIGISSETRFAYVLTFNYLLGPMETLVNKLPLLGQASVAVEKLESLKLEQSTSVITNLTTPVAGAAPQIASSQTANPLIATAENNWQQLSFKAVTHTYRTDQGEDEFTLGPIDLSVHPGELIFIVGGNGSGKSTLAKLITGLYTPQSGTILLNNQPIDRNNQEWYRQHFTAVFSDFYLFDRLLGASMGDNIGINNSTNEKAQEYLQKLQLSHKVKIEQGRFSTLDLSQGQRKRLALLRAYLENRPIYLFDEWAADQDPTFKQIFYTQLLLDLKAKGKTIFVISHDDHYFHLGDRLIKLNYGQLEHT